MSVARTARRRRKQAALGHKGLEQVFGKRHAPHYKKPDTSKLARKEAEFRERQRLMQGRGKK